MPELVFFSGTMDCGKIDARSADRAQPLGARAARHDLHPRRPGRRGQALLPPRPGHRGRRGRRDGLDFYAHVVDHLSARRPGGLRHRRRGAVPRPRSRSTNSPASSTTWTSTSTPSASPPTSAPSSSPAPSAWSNSPTAIEVLQVEALCWCGARATHNARTVGRPDGRRGRPGRGGRRRRRSPAARSATRCCAAVTTAAGMTGGHPRRGAVPDVLPVDSAK